MGGKYDFEVRLTRREYSALMDIRGLAHGAHMMVMTADMHDGGDWTLHGTHDDFDALLSDLDEEIESGIAPKKNLPALRRIRDYITPNEDEGDDPYTTGP